MLVNELYCRLKDVTVEKMCHFVPRLVGYDLQVLFWFSIHIFWLIILVTWVMLRIPIEQGTGGGDTWMKPERILRKNDRIGKDVFQGVVITFLNDILFSGMWFRG
jgi:hypothetical protein